MRERFLETREETKERSSANPPARVNSHESEKAFFLEQEVRENLQQDV